MKKYFLLAAISAALLLTACGSNQNNTAETSAQTSVATLNIVTEMTVPAFNPEWDETVVTSPAYDPNSDEPPMTTTSVCSVPLQTIEVVSETTIQTSEMVTESSPAQTVEDTTVIVPDAEIGENEHIAYVTAVYENKNGGYSLVVEAYDVMGYYSPVPVSLYSETEFVAGDWIKIEFAPETCFMETSPLQVNKSDILSIELIDY